jgi:hypothetical protein
MLANPLEYMCKLNSGVREYRIIDYVLMFHMFVCLFVCLFVCMYSEHIIMCSRSIRIPEHIIMYSGALIPHVFWNTQLRAHVPHILGHPVQLPIL